MTIPECVPLHVFDSLRVYDSGQCCRHGCGLFSFILARSRLSSLAKPQLPRRGWGRANTWHLLANQLLSSWAAWTEHEMFRAWADANSHRFPLRLIPARRAGAVRRRIQGAAGAPPRAVGGGGRILATRPTWRPSGVRAPAPRPVPPAGPQSGPGERFGTAI